MSKFDATRIRKRLDDVMGRLNYGPRETRAELTFHMTDWVEELEQWVSFCEKPDAFSDEDTGKILTRFLVHVPNHLAAASKLALNVPVTDIFGVGATRDDTDV